MTAALFPCGCADVDDPARMYQIKVELDASGIYLAEAMERFCEVYYKPRHNLEDYRLQKISEGSINVNEGAAKPLDGPTEVGSGLVREEAVPLSRLIDIINDRFGTDWKSPDQLFFDQIIEAAVLDENLKQAAAVNPEDKFELVFKNLMESLFMERMDQNEEIVARFMNDSKLRAMITSWLASEIYQKLGGKGAGMVRVKYPQIPDKRRK